MKSLNMKKILIICVIAFLGMQSCSGVEEIDRSLQDQSMLAVVGFTLFIYDIISWF